VRARERGARRARPVPVSEHTQHTHNARRGVRMAHHARRSVRARAGPSSARRELATALLRVVNAQCDMAGESVYVSVRRARWLWDWEASLGGLCQGQGLCKRTQWCTRVSWRGERSRESWMVRLHSHIPRAGRGFVFGPGGAEGGNFGVCGVNNVSSSVPSSMGGSVVSDGPAFSF